LARPSNEGPSRRIFIGARSLTHEHKMSLRIALTEDEIGARRPKLAAPAVTELAAYLFERLASLLPGCRNHCNYGFSGELDPQLVSVAKVFGHLRYQLSQFGPARRLSSDVTSAVSVVRFHPGRDRL
jgi:hypothetical protein